MPERSLPAHWTRRPVIPHRMTPDYAAILGWIVSLPSPVRVVYEAGPTGFGLARFLLTAGIDTLVAAPSKLRPSGTG